MPYIKRPSRVLTLSVSVLAAVLVGTAAPALAAAACTPKGRTHPYASFGDYAAYELLQGGTFESGTPGWSTENTEIVTDQVSAPAETHALKIHSYGGATSAPFCVSSEYPTFRFMLRAHNGYGSLDVGLVWSDDSGVRHETAVAGLEAGYSWSASPVLALASNLPLKDVSSSINAVHLVFKNTGEHSVEIADVYIDPYSR
jgi:hypothetical protein